MLNTVRLYLDAVLAVAIMAAFGVISGFAAAAITGDRAIVVVATAAVFVATGVVLAVRLWRMTRKPLAPIDPGI